MTTFALDFGSTKIDLCRLSKSGEIIAYEQMETASLGPGHPDFLERAFELVARHVNDKDDKIGVSWNAPVHEGCLTQSSLLGGRVDVDLGQLLRQKFQRTIQVESDVHAMALGEYRFGVGQSMAPMLLVNLGSGAGIGYHDGTLMRGFSGGAGLICMEKYFIPEIKRNVVFDHLFSGRGVVYLYHHLAGRTLTARTIAEQATTGEAAALRTFQILGRHFGHYLVTLSRFFNPRIIVLAGSLAKAHSLFLPQAREVVEHEIEPACQPQNITVSSLTAPACLGLV